MKVLLEVASGSPQSGHLSLFSWLRNKNNFLFILEDGKKMRTISTGQEPGKELQTATLVGARICTSLSCNEDGSLLALVVDRRQIYFWEVMTNSFVHFKPTNKMAYVSSATGKKAGRPKDIELLAWSKISNKLVICFSTGQLLLCQCSSTINEKFIENSLGALKQVRRVTCSDTMDVFAAITVISEILVMSFEGQTLFYLHSEFTEVIGCKLSRESKHLSNLKSVQHIWLAYRSNDSTVSIKRIETNSIGTETETSAKPDFVHRDTEPQSNLIKLHWISSNEILLCYSTGKISLAKIKSAYKGQNLVGHELVVENIVKLPVEEGDSLIYYSLCHDTANRFFSLAAITSYKILYYQMPQSDRSFEKVDDLDLSSSLRKINLSLTRVDWSNDCSMLAVQMSNGHLLVYRTRLPDMKVSIHGPRVAYYSGSGEVTILNFEPDAKETNHLGETLDEVSNVDGESQLGGQEMTIERGDDVAEPPRPLAGNALVLKVELKPSVLCVGPRHLALALNNRLQFYPLQISKVEGKQPIAEEDYISVIVGLSLSSSFVAIHFNDGRIKLQAIPPEVASLGTISPVDRREFDERFFPDPSKPEKISTFVLTEDLFVYCTHELQINVFNLNCWQMAQQTVHSDHCNLPFKRIYANSRGNKFICLVDHDTSDSDNPYRPSASKKSSSEGCNAYLYDLYTREVVMLLADVNEGTAAVEPLYSRLFKSQLVNMVPDSIVLDMSDCEQLDRKLPEKLNHIVDVVWDTDARTAILIEQKRMHIITCLDQTLDRIEGDKKSTVKYIDSVEKATSYTTLYASHGIVSFQTSLGRVINTILVSHDDELKLTRLEASIRELNVAQSGEVSHKESLKLQAEIMKLKLVYLRSVLPIHSVVRCKEICEHLMSDEVFNVDEQIHKRCKQIDRIIWLQLAAWSLYLMNLEFALFLYRKFQLPVHARALSEIIVDMRGKRGDSTSSINTRLMVLLGCDMIDPQ